MAKGNSNSLNDKSRSSKPYDARNSFVKQVKDRMTSYLPRFGLFSPPIVVEESNIAAPAPTTLNNESSSEDDETSSQQFAPPKKRARSELNQPLPLDAADSTPNKLFFTRTQALDFNDGTIAGPSGISRRPCLASSTPAIPQRYVRLEVEPIPNLIQASEPLANGDNESNSSMSTSGCSSLIPQAKYQAENNKSSTSVNNRSAQRRGCFGDRDMSTLPQTSRSMLDGSAPRATSAASSRQPSFNASVFSAPSTSPGAADSTGRSPFYAGRTQFGGASSYRRPRGALFTPLDAASHTARQTVQAKPLAGSSALDWGSCTARKILDTLDHLSSPVLDAKRIPSSPVLAGQNRKRAAHDASPGPTQGGPATEGLTIPTVQDLLKMQRQNQMRDSMEAARKVALSPALNPAPSLTETEKAYRTRLDADRERPSGGKMTGKMRSLEAEMSPAEPRLPAVTLSMVGLPTFTQDPRTAKPSRFTFSRPTPLNADEFAVAALKARAAAKKPATALNNNSADVKSRVAVAPPMAQFSTFSTSAKPREKSGYAEMSKAAAQNGKVGFSAAAELRTGSVMDILGKKPPPAAPLKPSGFGGQFSPAPGSWTCDSCLGVNAAAASACVSCTAPKAAPAPSFGGRFKPAPGGWTCASCLVQNKADDAACVSCAVAARVEPAGFGAAFRPPPGSWTCDACMVQNKADAAACVACQTAKTPSKPASGFGETLKPCSGFGETLKPSAGFGAQFKAAAGTWECDACMVRNEPGAAACVSCSTARPGNGAAAEPPKQAPASGFGARFTPPAATWECPSCLVRNGNGSVACIACEMRKPDARQFMAKPAPPPVFGAPKAATTFGSPSTAARFGANPTTSGFGSTSTASGFGSTTTASGFGSTTTGSGFGSTTTTSGFGSTTTGSGFGSTTTGSGFGSTTTASGFGSTTTASGFGSTPAASGNGFATPSGYGSITTGSGATSKPAFATAPKESGFGDAFKKTAGAWDCDACMVRNTGGDACVACETARPGCAPAGIKPAPAPAPAFAFGVDKAGATAASAPSLGGFEFGASAPVVAGGFIFGIPAKAETEATKPAAASSPDGNDRKRKGDDQSDSRAAKTAFGAFEPARSADAFAFDAPKTNGPVAAATATNNLFAFGATAAKPGPGFGVAAPAPNPFNATTGSAASGLFTTTANSVAPTTNMFATKTTSSFTPTSNFFATANTDKPSANLFSTADSSTPSSSFFATTANSTPPAASPFTTAAPSSVFAFGTTTQAKPAATGGDSAPKVVTFGSSFGAAKPQSGFGSLTAAASSSLGFPASNAPTPAAGFGAPKAAAGAAFSATPFVFGQAGAAPADKAFGAFGQATESKGFNFSSAPAATASPGFGFAAAPPTFAFSATPAPAAAAGGFAFGQPTAFNPGAQPKFNFTGGEAPLFTAAGAPNPAVGARRVIKKAVRRTPR